MKKLFLFLVLAGCVTAFAQWGGIKQYGRIQNGNIVVWERDGQVSDSGANVAILSNAVLFTSMIESTNQANGFLVLNAEANVPTNWIPPIFEVTSRKNVPNGYAGLNDEGKLNAELVETITVVFSGGQATE
jgi:hypothetical protein